MNGMLRLPPSVALMLVAIVIIVASLWAAVSSHRWEQRAIFVRPDGRYQLVVMRQRPLFPSMPGQAGDSPGEIVIQSQSGEVLFRKSVLMVQAIEGVEWGARKVYVKLEGEWALPD